MAHSNHHLLSHKGFVVEFCLENAQEGSEVVAKIFKMDKPTRKFVQTKVCVINTPQIGKLDIITAKCVSEENTGLVHPCVLLHNCMGDDNKTARPESSRQCLFQAVFLILDEEDARFLTCRRLLAPHDLCHGDVLETFQIVPGPRLTWHYHGDVYVADDKQNNGTLEPQKIATSSFSPLWWGKLGRTLVAMGTESCSASPDQEMETEEEAVADPDLIWGHRWMYVAMETKDEDWKKSDGSRFIPHPYACVARTVYVSEYRLIKQQIDGDNLEQEDADRTGDIHQSQILLATNQGQLVQLEDGAVRRICELPFQDPSDICVAYVSGGESLVLMTSPTGGVCAVWGSSFKPAGHWAEAHTALADYFLRCGTQQVLLLSGRGDDIFSGFLLTDLMGHNISEQEEEAEEEMGVSGTDRNAPMQSAIEALRARLYESQASLEELRSLSAQKDRVIQQTCTALRAMALQKEHIPAARQSTLPADPSLVCLYDGRDGSTAPDEEPPSPPQPAPITVVQVWQRLVLDLWVVGLEITNHSHRTLQDVRLTLVRNDEDKAVGVKNSSWYRESVSSCRVVPSIASSQIISPETSHYKSKKLKLDSGVGNVRNQSSTATLICVSPLPQFGAHPSVHCSLLLSWREGQGKLCGGIETEATCTDFCLDVGHVKLSVDDITSRHLTVLSGDMNKTAEMSQIDLLALDAVQSETRLKVRCRHGSLRQLPQMLQSTLGFQPIPCTPGLYCEQQGPLQYVRVTCTVISRGEADLCAYTRDLAQLSLLLHSLYHILPRGTKVLPDVQDRQVRAQVEEYRKSVDTELPHMSSKLRTLLQGEGLEEE